MPQTIQATHILDFGLWCDFITEGLESIPDAGDSLQALDEETSDSDPTK